MGNFFKAIANFFANLGKNPLIIKCEQFIESVFKAEVPIIIGALSDLATKAVAAAEANGVFKTLPIDQQGQAKYEAAFEQIKSDAKAIGIQAGSSVINLAIEMAVQALKGSAS